MTTSIIFENHIYPPYTYAYMALYKVYMKKARIFNNNRSKAVRLPKEFQFPGNEVYIKKIGSATILLPADKSPWQDLINSLDKFSDDFMNDRSQPEPQERDPIWSTC